MKHLVVLILPFLLILANDALSATVEGTVSHTDNNEPVAYALVIFLSNGTEAARTITGDDGYYFLNSISEGTYTVRVSHDNTVKEFPDVVIGPAGGTFDFQI